MVNMICGIIDQCGRRATTAKFLSANFSYTCRVFLVAVPVSAGAFTCDGIIALMSPILAKATLNLHSALHQPQVLSGLM